MFTEIAKLAVYRSFHTFRGLDSRLTSGSLTLSFLRTVGLLPAARHVNGTNSYVYQPNRTYHHSIFCLSCKSIQTCTDGVALPFTNNCKRCTGAENFWNWTVTTWQTFEQWPVQDQINCMNLLVKLSETKP
jgi:hypothetical protein